MNNKNIFTRQEKAAYKGERLHILQTPGFRELFILGCIATDAFTLFTVFDLLQTQRKELTIIVTIAVAAILDIIPMLLAACIWSDTMNRKMRKIFFVVLPTVFAVFFVMTFVLRFSSRGQLFQSSENSDSVSYQLSGSTEPADAPDETDNTFTPAQNALAVIYGLIPLGTSAVAFYVSYEVSPYRKRRHIRDLHKIELRAEIDQVRMILCELNNDMAFDYEAYDDAGFSMMAEQIRCIAEQDELKARRMLAEAEGTPEAISYIMEGGWKEDLRKGSEAESPPFNEGKEAYEQNAVPEKRIA